MVSDSYDPVAKYEPNYCYANNVFVFSIFEVLPAATRYWEIYETHITLSSCKSFKKMHFFFVIGS